MCLFCELKLAAQDFLTLGETVTQQEIEVESSSKSFQFEVFNQKWGAAQDTGSSGGVVTYSFATQNYGNQFSEFDSFIMDDSFKFEISQAFSEWENIADIRFALVEDSRDVDIRFGWQDIDLSGGVLARTTVPTIGPLSNVLVALDVNESWFTNGDAPVNQIDFSSTVIHEIGHAIGIGHSQSAEALMHANYSTTTFTLQQDDIDAAIFIYGENETVKTAIHRFFNPEFGGHFFTADEPEREIVEQSDVFNSEGVGFFAVSRDNEPVAGSVPVYRFFNSELGSHFFTAFENEKTHVLSLDGFIFEGVGFRAFELQTSTTKPVYRFFNSETGGHFFTTNELERNAVMDLEQFRYEGEAFYAF